MEEIKPREMFWGTIVGFIASNILAATLVVAGLRAGITPGVSPLVVLFCWIFFGSLFHKEFKGFAAIAQVTGSAGSAVTAGVIFVAPILQIIHKEHGLLVPDLNVWLLIVASLSGSLMGWGFVSLATKKFLTDPRLPAPEAVACDRLIRTAAENPSERPPIGLSLVPGLISGFFVKALIELKYIKGTVEQLSFSVPGYKNFFVSLPVTTEPLYLGIGALLTVPTATLMFIGGVINSVAQGYARAVRLPETTYRWVGGAAMTVAVLFTIFNYLRSSKGLFGKKVSSTEISEDDPILTQSPEIRQKLYLAIATGAVLFLAMMVWMGSSILALVAIGLMGIILMTVLSGLGALLSLQVGSSASPVSGTVFMGLLVLSLVGLAVGLHGMDGVIFLVPILVAICVGILSANDSSQDYKTMQLNGFRVSQCFNGQIIGLLGGAVVVPVVLWLAHNTYGGLGSAELPAPQASFFSTILSSIFLDSQVPWGPVGVGACIGFIAVLTDYVGRRKGVILSSVAFAVGIYLPAVVGSGILLGAVARLIGTRMVNATTHRGILMAAGLITGDSLFSLVMGGAILANMDLASWTSKSLGASIYGTGFLLIILLFITLNFDRRFIKS